MADVFVSYARADDRQAERVAEALRAQGYRVWRDDELPAHRAYSEVIEERLKLAKAVVVLWSAEAAKSQWVRAEADAVRATGTLIQASLDGTVPPLPFNQIQCADLTGWDGKTDSLGWRKLSASVAALVGPALASSEANQHAGQRQLSVCILPFQNMSGDPEQEYFSDGISEDITTDISKVSALEVVARNTAFTFKGQSVNVCDVARQLGVTHVLEGSVRKVGERVRITAQLIDGRSGGHLWAERFDRNLTDIFAIQDEITKEIVHALRLKLLPEEKKAIEKRGTQDAQAYNFYLLARQYWVTGNHGDARREERVMRICSRAVELDPQYADAWALLAIAQSSLCYGFGRSEVDDGFAAANAALSIDPDIPQARVPLAKRHMQRGNTERAAAEMAKAIELGEDSWEVQKEAGRYFLNQRDVALATRHYENAVELLEHDFHSWAMLATCYHAGNEPKKLREAAKKMVSESQLAVQQDPSNGAALGILAGGYALLGESERAREAIERALLVDPDNLTMRYNFACILAAHLCDHDGAIKLLESTLPIAGPHLVQGAASDPDLDSLREHPRFEKLVAEVTARHGIERAGRPTAMQAS